jgi:RES domain-containing protein
MTVRWIIAVLGVAVLTGCETNRIDSLDKRVTALEAQTKEQKAADAAQHQAWLSCRDAADDSFDEGLRMSGQKDPKHPNRYWTDSAVYRNMQETWRDAVADCDRKYPRR